MRHEEEWYTCDRCGKEVETVPERLNFIWRFFPPKIYDISVEQAESYFSAGDLVPVPPEKCAMSITQSYCMETKNIIYAIDAVKILRGS